MSSKGNYGHTYRCKFYVSHNCDNRVYMNGERCHDCIIKGRGTPEEHSGRIKIPEHVQQVIEGSIPPLDHKEYVEYPDGSTGQRCMMYYTPRLCKNFTRNEGLIHPPSLCDSCPEPATTKYQTNVNYYRCIYYSASSCTNWNWKSGIPCRACEPSRDSIVKEHRTLTHSTAPPRFFVPGEEDAPRRTVRERNETAFEIREFASQIPHQSTFDNLPVLRNDPATQKYAIEVANLLDDMGKRLNDDSPESEGLSPRLITPAVLPSCDSPSKPTTSNYQKQTLAPSVVPQVYSQYDAQNAWAGWVTQTVKEIESANVGNSQGGIPSFESSGEKGDRGDRAK